MFNVTTNPASNLPSSITGYFDTSNTKVRFDVGLMELYFNTAEKVVDEALDKNSNLFNYQGFSHLRTKAYFMGSLWAVKLILAQISLLNLAL